MACCGKKEGCASNKRRKPIPWFSVLVAVVVLLVIINWQ